MTFPDLLGQPGSIVLENYLSFAVIDGNCKTCTTKCSCNGPELLPLKKWSTSPMSRQKYCWQQFWAGTSEAENSILYELLIKKNDMIWNDKVGLFVEVVFEIETPERILIYSFIFSDFFLWQIITHPSVGQVGLGLWLFHTPYRYSLAIGCLHNFSQDQSLWDWSKTKQKLCHFKFNDKVPSAIYGSTQKCGCAVNKKNCM